MDKTALALANHVSKTSFDRLPAKVVKETKKFILDTLGVGLAGAKEPGSVEAFGLAEAWSSNDQGSTVIYYGNRVSPPDAACVNSVMMHALDFDDTLDSSALHAHVSSLPASLSLAEVSVGTSGRELITAVALGVDVTCRLAQV